MGLYRLVFFVAVVVAVPVVLLGSVAGADYVRVVANVSNVTPVYVVNGSSYVSPSGDNISVVVYVDENATGWLSFYLINVSVVPGGYNETVLLPVYSQKLEPSIGVTYSVSVFGMSKLLGSVDVVPQFWAVAHSLVGEGGSYGVSTYYSIYSCTYSVYSRYIRVDYTVEASAVVGGVNASIYSNLTGTWSPCSVAVDGSTVYARCPTTPAMVNGSAELDIRLDGAIVSPQTGTVSVVVVDQGSVSATLAEYSGALPWDAGWASANGTYATVYLAVEPASLDTYYATLQLNCNELPPWEQTGTGEETGGTPADVELPETGFGSLEIGTINTSINITLPTPSLGIKPLRPDLTTPEGIFAAGILAAVTIALMSRMGFTDGAIIASMIVTMYGYIIGDTNIFMLGAIGFAALISYRYLRRHL